MSESQTPFPETVPTLAPGAHGPQAERARPDRELLDNIHTRLVNLEELLAECDGRWAAEDLVYRFWHQSFKVFGLQTLTERIVAELVAVQPAGTQMHPWFSDIITAGTGLRFEMAMNDDWSTRVRPVVDAFFHAKFMLEMTVRYGRELETAPDMLPSGWAALLELYCIR